MSLYGFDYFNAMMMAVEIDAIGRFESAKKLVSWGGVCPSVHQSGKVTYHGRMKKDTNRKVNWVLIQAANSASRTDPRMKAYYKKIRKRRVHSIAVTHVANKMMTIIWHILKKSEPYEGVNETLYAQKLKNVDRA